MPRYFCQVAYHGASYHGWQIQKNANSIQAELSEALTRILRSDIEITGSGRTDKGVHASKQIFHFDSLSSIQGDTLTHRLNSLLPNNIAIKEIVEVADTAHARFDATRRGYVYRINRTKSPFEQGLSYFYHRPLQVELMNEAAEMLLGKHDYQAFSKVHTEVNNFFCDIFESYWTMQEDILTYHVTANRFLRGMVRAIVGTLLLVGENKIDLDTFANIIKSGDRRRAGRSVPAEGLYLSEVEYPDSIFKS